MAKTGSFFTAKYLDKNGAKVVRDFFDMSEHAIGRLILGEGGTIISIRAGHISWINKEYYSSAFKINFLDAIARRVKSGRSPSQALEAVILNERSRAKRREMEVALQTLNTGRDFSDAIEKLGFFSESLVAILRAGEKSGMSQAIETAKGYLASKKAVMQQFGTAMFWILLEFSSAVTVPFTVQWEGLPWIESHANSSSNAVDVAAFKHDMHLAYLINGVFMWFTVVLLIGCVALFISYRRSNAVRRRIGEWLIRIPILNRFIVDSAIADSFLIASNMLRAHVPFFEVVATLRAGGSSGLVKNYWDDVSEHLESVGDPSEALISAGLLHKEEIQLLEFQGSSQQLAESLLNISEDRAHSASHGRVMAIWMSAVLMIVYSAVSLGVAAWVYLIYSASVDAGLKDMTGMGF